mgnify:CR=1 FL=1
MDKVVELLQAKVHMDNFQSNLGMWVVDSNIFLKKLSDLYAIGFQFPSLMNGAGNYLYIHGEMEKEDISFVLVLKSDDPKQLKESIVSASKNIFIKYEADHVH